MELVFLQGAETDIQAVFESYGGGSDSQRAEAFLKRLDQAMELLRENPAMAPVYDGQFRRLILRGFSHGVFYTITGNRIFVARVLDLRQDRERLRRELGLRD